MREGRRRTRHQVKETEANRFAISPLAPPRLAKRWVEAELDLMVSSEMAKALEVSRQAALICCFELHDEPIAAVFSANGVVIGVSRGVRLPRVKLVRGDRLGGWMQAGRLVADGRSGRTAMGGGDAGGLAIGCGYLPVRADLCLIERAYDDPALDQAAG